MKVMDAIQEGYKQTELDEVSRDWEVVLLDSCVKKIIGGGTPSRKIKSYYEGNIPWATVKDLDGKLYKEDTLEHISKEAINKSSTNLIAPGNVIIATRMGLGRGFINKVHMAINQDLKAIYPKEQLQAEFLLYWILHNHSIFESMGKGSTVKGVSLEELKSLLIPLPPLPEQKKITDILLTVDEQIEQTEQLIEKTNKLKKGLMQKLLMKGIGHARFKKTEVGEIPEEWEVKRLGDVTEVVSGGTPSRNVKEFWENGDIMWAIPTDITSNGKYINQTESKITEMGLKNSAATILPPGSILMTSRATIGERCINTVPMATNQGFKSFICKDELNNEYLYYLIDRIKGDFIRLAGGSTFLEVSKTTVENYKIPVPPKSEQIRISSILSSIDERIEQYDFQKQQLQRLKKGLMQKLLTGKIRVKV